MVAMHYDDNGNLQQGSLLTLGEYIPVIESNFEPRREGQSRKLSTFKGRTEGENQNEKFSDVL